MQSETNIVNRFFTHIDSLLCNYIDSQELVEFIQNNPLDIDQAINVIIGKTIEDKLTILNINIVHTSNLIDVHNKFTLNHGEILVAVDFPTQNDGVYHKTLVLRLQCCCFKKHHCKHINIMNA
jgi:hypothetical protein